MIDSIDEIRVADFIMSLSKDIDSELLELKEYAIQNNIPIIRDETRDLLRMLLSISKPKEILEIGTAIGYSTIVMHKVCDNAHIVTIENYLPRIECAKKNLLGYKNIDLIEKDASVYLKETKGVELFDFVFLDAAKGQYINWLYDIKRLMKKNAIMVADNIFKDGEILESKFLIKKRDRTIHKRMRDFLYTISNDKEFDTSIFNLGDGMSISIKK